MENFNQLWEAVVTRAVLDLQSESEEIRQEAADWFFIENEDFGFVCEALDIKPEKLRERLLQGGYSQCKIKLT